MRTKQYIGLGLLVSLVFLALGADVALAASDAHGGKHSATIGMLFWPAINFGLYLFVMVSAYKKLAAPALRQQKAEVKEQYESGRAKLADARRQLAVLKARHENLTEERAQVLNSLKEETKALTKSILEKSVEDCQYVMKDVERRIASEQSKIEAELRSDVVRKATSDARAELSRSLDDDHDARLRRDAVARFRA